MTLFRPRFFVSFLFIFLPAPSCSSHVSLGSGPPQYFKAAKWQVKYGTDKRPLNGSLVWADAFPLVVAGAGGVLPYPDICDVRTWWPLTPAQTTSLSLMALITPYTAFYCGAVKSSSSAFMEHYVSAGFVSIVFFYSPVLQGASFTFGPVYSDFHHPDYLMWVIGPQYDGALPLTYALESFFGPNATTAVKVQFTFDEWNCANALVSPAMDAVSIFGIVCSVGLFVLTVLILFKTRREPTSLAKVAIFIEGIVAAPLRAYKSVIDPQYVVPSLNLVFWAATALSDELISHVANTIVTFIFCELVVKIWMNTRPTRKFQIASNVALVAFVMAFCVPPFVFMFQAVFAFNGLQLSSLTSGDFSDWYSVIILNEFDYLLYFDVTMIALNVVSSIALVVLMKRASRSGSTLLANKATEMNMYMALQVVCYIPIVVTLAFNRSNVDHLLADEPGCFVPSVIVYMFRPVSTSLLGIFVVVSLYSYTKNASNANAASASSASSSSSSSSSSSATSPSLQ